jgi:hypothetical protein
MERTAAARSDYARAAYDHTRAEMLAMVDQEWELDVKAPERLGEPMGGTGSGAVADYVDKLSNTVVPFVALDEVNLITGIRTGRLLGRFAHPGRYCSRGAARS